LQILLNNVDNPIFDEVKISNDSVKSDIILSADKTHLYAITNSTVCIFSVYVQVCLCFFWKKTSGDKQYTGDYVRVLAV